MASAGTSSKRSYEHSPPPSRSHHPRDHDRDDSRRDKPRDWRDAFLEDEAPRRSGGRRDRSRSGERDRNADRHRSRPDHRDSRGFPRDIQEYDRKRDRGLNYRDESHHRGPSYRDREPPRDPPPRRPSGEGGAGGHAAYRREDVDRRSLAKSKDKEEGEIEPSPPPLSSRAAPERARVRHGSALPYEDSPRRSSLSSQTSHANGNGASERKRDEPPLQQGGFKAVPIPSGPRSNVPQTRPNATNVFENGVTKPTEGQAEEEPVIVLEEERDPEKILEERRRKRQEILAKFKATGGKAAASTPPTVPSGQLHLVGTGLDSINSGGTKTGMTTTAGVASHLRHLGARSTTVPGTPSNFPEPSLAATPGGVDFDLSKQQDSSQAGEAVLPPGASQGPGADMLISAADYDPTKEAIADREKRLKDAEALKEAHAVAEGVGEPIAEQAEEDLWEEVEIEVEEEEDDVDMFAAFGGEEREKKKRKVTVRRLKQAGADGQQAQIVQKRPKEAAAAVVDNVDDEEGYYRITPGEIIDDGRYQVTINLGKGMFSSVVKAKILKAVDQERRQDVVGKEVAIKIVRSQESMYVAGRKESQILKKLNDADPEDRKHIVRMERTFEHRGHLCIVTESLSMNLRDVIKRFGKDVGLNMRAVRAYAHQLFLALSLMRKCSIVHADIKPDNILVTENKATLKVCDLGSASDLSEGEITPYLVSRFYRAPEIILGLPYDTAIDTWAVGCTLYELYSGKILFPGRSNNHMLLLMMEVKGKLNHRMIKKATFGEMHFDENMNFVSIEKDKITGQEVAKTLALSKATKDLRSRLLPSSSVQVKMKEDELKMLQNFIDLLEKCLQLDPTRRLSPRDALLHPFLTG